MKRLHTTNNPELILDQQYTQLGAEEFPVKKPSGLWYSMGEGWLEWVTANMPEKKGKYTYHLDIDDTDILKISTLKELTDFISKYQNKVGHFYGIDWHKVSQTHSGFEFINCHSISKKYWNIKHIWVLMWDCDSGCLWDLSKIKSSKRKKTHFFVN